MLLGIQTETWEAIGVVGGGIGTIASLVIGRLRSSDAKAHRLELAAIKDHAEAEVATVKSDLTRAEARLDAAWLKIDDLRENAVRKVEMKEYREEIRRDIRELGETLKQGMREMVDGLRRELTPGTGN